MAAILFDNTEPFERNDNMPSTEGPMCNLVDISQGDSETKTVKVHEILYMFETKEARANKLGGQNFDCC